MRRTTTLRWRRTRPSAFSVGEVHVGFVDHEQTALEAFCQCAQVAARSQRARRRVGTAHDREIGARVGERVERQREIVAERDVEDARLLHERQGVVQRIGRDGIGNGVAVAERGAEHHREQFVRAVAGEDHALRYRVDFRSARHEFVGARGRIEAQRRSRHRSRNGTADSRRRRIRILIGVELDQALAGTRLLAGPIRRHAFDRFAKHV